MSDTKFPFISALEKTIQKYIEDNNLVEVVRCKDCKYLNVINKAPVYACCSKHNHTFYLWEEDTRNNFCSWSERREDTDNSLLDITTVEAEPEIHGHWEWDGYVYDMPWQCSECSCFNEYDSDYCPNCGAKMDDESIANIFINNSNATTVTNNDNAMSTVTRGENMPDSMMFPKTVDEFMEQYKIVDTDEVYTNGAELVPIFRMKQWFEHVDSEPKHAYVIVDDDGNMECSNCGSSFCFDNYCGHCGAKLIGERKYEVEDAE